MKNQAFFSLKDKSKKLKCHLLQFLLLLKGYQNVPKKALKGDNSNRTEGDNSNRTEVRVIILAAT